MALIECQECGKDVSELAAACPHCGAPVRQGVQTVEKTGKKWKGMKIIAWSLMLLSLPCFLNPQHEGNTALGLILLLLGATLWLYAALQTWWHHD
ncbi:MAG: hypothetical protein ACLQBD_01190 [Syntrophobacteraceae bacterium]